MPDLNKPKVLKAELIQMIADDHQLSKKEAEAAVEAVTESLAKLLVSGRSVSFNNLGTFKVVLTAERNAVNPNTGEKMTVPSRRKVSFKMSPSLKTAL